MRFRIFIMAFSAIIRDFAMLEGRCLKCGIRYYGWALLNPQYQTCPDCGRGLEIKDNNGTISEGYSPSIIDKSLLEEIMNNVDDDKKYKDKGTKDD